MVEQLRSENAALRSALQAATSAVNSHSAPGKTSPPRDPKVNGTEPAAHAHSGRTAPQQPVSDVRSEGRASKASDEEVAEQVTDS
ncbi:hypothetical protein CALCODRAFT_494008 [Calocera cornea HHB12733]|uniref:Uncharacterized protein n=1 Tax=Calocera cornea HHB12733 TaxID=1353952 RepID=A0A165HEY9_9BASI|nr:hypothetical protein CALCODRAFT_494008 [Calocera cornea HHB12733]